MPGMGHGPAAVAGGAAQRDLEAIAVRVARVAAALLRAPMALVVWYGVDGQTVRGAVGVPAADVAQLGAWFRAAQPQLLAARAPLRLAEVRARPPRLLAGELRDGVLLPLLDGVILRGVIGVLADDLLAEDSVPAALNDVTALALTALLQTQADQVPAVEWYARQSETRFREMADQAPVLMWMAAPDGRCTFFNRAWLAFTGRTLEQELGDGWFDTVHPQDRILNKRVFLRAARARAPFQLEYRVRRADGQYRWIYDAGLPVFAPNGELRGYIGAAIDITERKQVEERIAQSEERYRSIFQFMPISIWEEDWSGVLELLRDLRRMGVRDYAQYVAAHPEWVMQALRAVRILDVNEATVALFKAQTKQQLLGSLQIVFSSPELLPGFVQELVALSSGQPVFETEMQLRTLSGEPLQVLLRMSFPPLDGDSGTVLVGLIDITERKRIEQRQAHEARLLEVLSTSDALAPMLEEVVLTLEASLPPLRAAVLLLERDGQRGQQVVAPGLPTAYQQCLEQADGRALLAACTAAAQQTTSLLVSDIECDPWWEPLRAAARQAGLRTCWLVPIGSAPDALSAIVLLHHPERCQPRADEAEWLARLGRMVSLAIDRVQRTAALRASEEFLRRMIESSTDCIKVLDLEGRLLAISSGGQRLMEIDDLQTCLQAEWVSFWQGPLQATVRAAVATARAGGVGRFSGFCPTMKGTPKWWDVVVTPMLGADGQPQQLLAVSRDISERVQAEERLRRLQTVTAELSRAVTPKQVARVAVKQGLAATGGSAGALLTLEADTGALVLHYAQGYERHAIKRWRRVPLDAPLPVVAVARSGTPLWLETPEQIAEEFPLFANLSATRSRAVAVVPLSSERGLLGVLSINFAAPRRFEPPERELLLALARQCAQALERARLYEAERRARQEAQRAAALARLHARQLSGLARAALRINAALSIDRILETTIIEARELIGAHQAVSSFTINQNWAQAINTVSLSDKYAAWRSYDAPPDGSGIYAEVCRTNRPMRLTQAELEAHPLWRGFGAEAGRHPPMRGWLAAPLVGRDGRNLGLLQLSDKQDGSDFTAEDEAILVQLAQMAAVAIENARLYHEAQEAILARDEFLSVASHELKTPLTALELQTQSLLRLLTRQADAVPRERLTSKLQVIDQQAQRLTQLSNDLLDVARIRLGRIELRFEPVDLVALVQEVLARFEEQAQLTGSAITLHAPSALPLVTDRGRVEQILTNLLSNALKYGAGRPIEVVLSATATQVELQVRDHGIGIAPEHLERIFVRFERVVSSRHYSGLGLGLYITRQLVEALGGQIRVSSTVNVGSTFTVSLPRGIQDDA